MSEIVLEKICLSGEEKITSDTHFYHQNVISYCNRPFQTKEEMNETMITNWNESVKPGETIIHLGDFAFSGRDMKIKLLSSLTGHKVLIRGNHDDRPNAMLRFGFHKVKYKMYGTLPDGRTFAMSHIPDLQLSRDFDIHFCGHVHEKWCFLSPNIYNVGVDHYDFRPQTINYVLQNAERIQKNMLVQISRDDYFSFERNFPRNN